MFLLVVEGFNSGIEKKAMPFSFHSWLERLPFSSSLASLAETAAQPSATRHLSVREALGRRWRHPGSIPASTVASHASLTVGCSSSLSSSSFPTNHHQPTPSTSLIDSCQERASLPSWTSEPMLFFVIRPKRCRSEAVRGSQGRAKESSRHHCYYMQSAHSFTKLPTLINVALCFSRQRLTRWNV